jgi:hypothetical protein
MSFIHELIHCAHNGPSSSLSFFAFFARYRERERARKWIKEHAREKERDAGMFIK